MTLFLWDENIGSILILLPVSGKQLCRRNLPQQLHATLSFLWLSSVVG